MQAAVTVETQIMISRRILLSTALGSASAALIAAAMRANAQSDHLSGLSAVEVHEITMATPDTLCVEVRDPSVRRGAFVELAAPDPGPQDVWVQRNNPNLRGSLDYCQVVGRNRDHLRFGDIPASVYYERATGDVAADYGPIGGLTVTNVYRKSMPYDFGMWYSAANGQAGAVSMKHFLFLKLSGRLSAGLHTISFPKGTGLASVLFTFNDKATRAIAIRATQVGHRPRDAGKLAYLALWIPGAPDEGAVDFVSNYDIRSFNVIDETGVTVFSGPINQRATPHDVEPNSGFPNNIAYASTNVAPLRVIAITAANPAVVTSSTHGLSNGDVIYLRGIGGSMSGLIEARPLTVAVVDKDRFSIGVDTTGRSYAPSSYAPGFSDLIYKTWKGNRCGTFVFGLDYGSWAPKSAGNYRIHVSGLGVSDPFTVDDALWYRVAQNSAKGAYNQRNGLTLDGRFGYTRPVCFRPGQNGVRIYKSNLPSVFSNEWNQAGGGLKSSLGGTSPYITNEEVVCYGGWMDAGDWDTSIFAHGKSAWNLLDIGYVHLPVESRNTNFNIPKSSHVLDPDLYAETDHFPDCVHEALWCIDFYRQAQDRDGSVGSGRGYYPGGGTGYALEPSFISRAQAFIYAPDHASNFVYAGCAAKLAQVFADAGLSSLANVWQISSEKAWAWAEKLFHSFSAQREYYSGVLNLQANAGWEDATFVARMEALDNLALQARQFAACSLLRLTRNFLAYGPVAKTVVGQPAQGYRGCAAWEYYNTPGIGLADKAGLNFVRGITIYQLDWANAPGLGYTGIGYSRGPTTRLDELAVSIIRAYIYSKNSQWLKLLQNGLCFIHGANQYGMCMTSGIGARNTRCTLLNDTRFVGILPFVGITNYAWWPASGGGLPVLNFSTDAPINFIVENPTGRFQSSYGMQRVMEPYRFAIPLWEQVFENPFIIFQMEFTTEENIIPQMFTALWLHGWDGNKSQAPT
jgi:endoglucanase